MSNRNSEHPGSVRPHAEPLDDIILEGDDDAGHRAEAKDAEKATQPRRDTSRAPPPSSVSDEAKKAQRQKLLRIPDDEVSRPSQLPYVDSEPRVPARRAFDPESTVKMSALELDSAAELPPQPHEARAPHDSHDDESWTPLQPVAEPEPPKAEWSARTSAAIDQMRAEMPTPPPTSEEIPVALEDPASSENIPVAEPSSPIDLSQRSSPPGAMDDTPPPQRARTQTAPIPPEPPPNSRDQLATVLDSVELGSIDVNFQSAPNFDAIEAEGRGKAPLQPKSVSPRDSISTEIAPDDVVAIDSNRPAQHAPPPPPPPRAKTQSTPSIPPQPPPPPPMRPKSQSTPSVPPGTLSPVVAPQAAQASPAQSSPAATTPSQGTGSAAKPAKPPPPAPATAPMMHVASAPAVAHGPPVTQAAQAAPAHPAPPAPKPMLIVPPGAEVALAPPPLHEARAQKRVRPWWEELFNDDFIRAMEKLTDPQIKREADFIEDSLGVAKGAMVLDLACGTGRHAIELSKRGYGVVGFDLSLAMLARAAEEADERSATLNFVQGDMREMTFEEMFDGIYSWSTSFGFFEEEKNQNVIQRVHRALKKGGQFLLDVVNRDYVARQAPSLVWFEGDGCVCMDEMSIDWITSRMKIKRTMMIEDGRSREIEFSMRLYALHELGKMLHEAGFRVAEVSGRTATPGVFFGADSPRTIILAEKRA